MSQAHSKPRQRVWHRNINGLRNRPCLYRARERHHRQHGFRKRDQLSYCDTTSIQCLQNATQNRVQIVTGSQKHRDPRFLPYAFTEHGTMYGRQSAQQFHCGTGKG